MKTYILLQRQATTQKERFINVLRGLITPQLQVVVLILEQAYVNREQLINLTTKKAAPRGNVIKLRFFKKNARPLIKMDGLFFYYTSLLWQTESLYLLILKYLQISFLTHRQEYLVLRKSATFLQALLYNQLKHPYIPTQHLLQC